MEWVNYERKDQIAPAKNPEDIAIELLYRESFKIDDYNKARELFKKMLFDKLMIDRFGWEIWIEGEKFEIESPLTEEDQDNKKDLVKKVVRYLIFEYDKYKFIEEENIANFEFDKYQSIPTLLCLLSLSTEIHDSNTSQVYEVDPKTFERLERIDGPIKDN